MSGYRNYPKKTVNWNNKSIALKIRLTNLTSLSDQNLDFHIQCSPFYFMMLFTHQHDLKFRW